MEISVIQKLIISLINSISILIVFGLEAVRAVKRWLVAAKRWPITGFYWFFTIVFNIGNGEGGKSTRPEKPVVKPVVKPSG